MGYADAMQFGLMMNSVYLPFVKLHPVSKRSHASQNFPSCMSSCQEVRVYLQNGKERQCTNGIHRQLAIWHGTSFPREHPHKSVHIF